jgi:glycosyltransferase involved in cell wall biosynthesis
MVPRKGIDNVVRALAPLVREHGVDAQLLVVGGEADTPCEVATPEIRRLRTIAEELGVRDRLRFTGRRRRGELRAFYSAADAFVTTPWYEPFGITPLESMACGTPVVGARVGGIKFSVVDRVTGFLVPPNDPGALAEKLAILAANPALARAMGRAGMHRARSMFTWERITQQLVRIYVELACTRAPRPQPTIRRPVLLTEATT